MSHWWTSRAYPEWPASPIVIAATATVVTAATLVLAREVLWPKWARVLRSPLKTTLPYMRKEDIADLVYQPDQFPGARDVETPVSFGKICAYPRYPAAVLQADFFASRNSTALFAFMNLDLKMERKSCSCTELPLPASLSHIWLSRWSNAAVVLCFL